jgi:hypothetical protein
MLPCGKGLLVMLRVFLDRGAKSDAEDGVVAVAATVFKPLGYKRFVRPWNRMLRRWGASAFHATDFYNGAGEFKRDTAIKRDLHLDDSRLIPKLVGENIEYILVVAARPHEFINQASEKWKANFGTNVHAIGVQMVLITLGWWAEKHRFNERYAYFRESGDEDDAEVASTVEGMRTRDSDTARVIRVSSFAHIEKGIARGTEASDFVAWHWNKWYMDKIRHGKKLDPRKDFHALVDCADHKFKYIFLSGDSLKYFFSLKPKEGSAVNL